MKSVSIWVSRCSDPNTFERIVSFNINELVDEVKIKFEELQK